MPAASVVSLLVALLLTSGCGPEGSPEDDRAADAREPGPESPGAETAAVVADSGFLTGAADARIHYRVLGEAPDTVVAIHGGPGAGMHSIVPDLEPLAKSFTVIFYDQRGGGLSELPADTSLLRAEYFVEDLEAVRRHFGLERMKLFTHSFGSILAARYAKRYPDRVDRMVFHKGTGPDQVAARELARAAQRPAGDDTLAARQTELLGSLLRGEAEAPVETCRAYEEIGRRLAEDRGEPVTWRGSTCDAPAEAVRYYYRYTARWAPRTFGPWDFTTGLEHVTAPLLVVHGGRDSAAISQQRAWASAVPNGRLLIVPEAGPSAWTKRPDVVFPAVETFFAGSWPEGAERP
jgi:proline iminopeptidase